MKNYTLQPTNDNIVNTFCMDALGRNEEIIAFFSLLNYQDTCTVIALDGKWGCGKTFFIKQVKLLFDYSNEFNDASEEDRRKISQYLKEQKYDAKLSTSQLQATFYYDAWENDNHVDPILSLIYTIVQSGSVIGENGEQNIHLQPIVKAVFNLITNNKLNNLVESFNQRNFLECFHSEESVRDKLNELFEALTNEHGNRLVVFVDELDRCNPSFAVRFLERIKHYFNDDRFTFVFSINMQQLQHTVKRYYGEGFDAYRYLDKFFDLRIPMPKMDWNKVYEHVDVHDDRYYFTLMCKRIIQYFSLSLREIERFMSSAHAIMPQTLKMKPIFSDGKARMFGVHVFTPIIMGLLIVSKEKYQSFIDGNEADLAVDILNVPRLNSLVELCSNNGEKGDVDFSNLIREIYLAFFGKNMFEDSDSVISVGGLEISNKCRQLTIDSASLMSPLFTRNKQ